MLEIDDLTMRFGGVAALESVTATIEPGSVVGLIGPNGAGKSTFVNCVTGTIPPTSGRVRWCGSDLNRMQPHRIASLGISRTYQHAHLFHGFSALENVIVGAHRHGTAGVVRSMFRTRRARSDDRRLTTVAEEALAAVRAHQLAHVRVEDLTAGQQRLVAVARALAAEPSFLLLDEPAAGLTNLERADLLADLQRYFAQHEVTGVVIEHHLGFLMQLVDDVVVLVEGKVLTRGAPGVVRSDPRVIEAYVGA